MKAGSEKEANALEHAGAADEEELDDAYHASDPAQAHLLKAMQRTHLTARDSGLRGPKLEVNKQLWC